MTNLGVNTLRYVAKTYFYVLAGLYIYITSLAQAEWLAAQMDERAMEGLEDDDEEGVSFLFKLVEQTSSPPHTSCLYSCIMISCYV